LIEIEQQLAKNRMLEGDPRQNIAEGKVVEIIAPSIGTNPETLRETLWLIDNAPKEDLEKLRSGERAISNLYKEIKHEEKVAELKEKAKTLQAPEGLFDVLVVDPPWNYGTSYNPEGRRVASPYPEMSLDELKSLKLPTNENCVLWLWTTNAFLHEAFHILEAWGFEQKTILTWAKTKMGLGDWLRGQTEHCLLAIKGKPIINLTNQTTLLNGESKNHSQKPDEFYKLVDSLCFGKKLDYFGREKHEGWEIYGTGELT
jgi:N6-adenosine-specific RNA methylase IME4